MTVALQIRDVPDEVRDVLAQAASEAGQSLQALLLGIVTREARFLARADIFFDTAEVRVELPPPGAPDSVESIIREGRDGGFEVERA